MNTLPHPVKTRSELLAHYAHKPVTRFFQMDGWPPDMCDSVIADCGGYGLTGGTTSELMSGAYCVRVLVTPGADPVLVKKILQAAADFYPRIAGSYDNKQRPGTEVIADLHSAGDLVRLRQEREASYRLEQDKDRPF